MFTPFEAIAFVLISIIIGSIYWYATIPKNLPPGPVGLPLLGNALDYLRPTDQHHIVLDQIKKYGSIFRLYIGEKLIVVLGDYESINEALVKQGDVFAGRAQVLAIAPKKFRRLGLISSEGDLWKEHRRFALSTLRDFGIGRPIIEPRIKEETDHLTVELRKFAANGKPVDMQGLLTCTVSNVISQLIFGRRFEYDDEEFVHQFYLFSKRVAGTEIGMLSPIVFSDKLSGLIKYLPQFRRLQAEVDDFADYMERETERVIATFDKSEEPMNYIHAYLKAADETKSDTFTRNQMQAAVNDLFLAGTETTSTTIRYAILLLAHHPQVQEKMFHEIKDKAGVDSLPDYADRTKLPYCEAVVMETQRVSNLVPFGVGRRTLAKTKLMGYDIPEDTLILPFLTSVLNDEGTFKDASKFNPERFIGEDGKAVKEPKLIPFQAGKRICLGEALARMELFLLLIGLISRFRFYFPEDEPKPTLKPLVGILTAPAPYKICVEER